MDFSLTTLFVVPVGNTLPTSGSTETLTDGQFGITKDSSMTAATAGNIGSATYIQMVQGRPSSYLGTKRSDKIQLAKVKKWYKVTGNSTAANEIWQFSDFTAGCEEDITLTLRGHSSFLDTIAFNGFTRSVTIKTPCCDCGGDPCDVVANETLIDLFLEKIAEEAAVQNAPNALTMSTFWSFTKVGTGADAILIVETKPLAIYSRFCNVAYNPYEFDRIYFRGWVYKNPDVTVDFIVYDRCTQAATATLTQRSSYPRGTSDQIYQMEIDYYSYQSDFKHLFQQSAFNQKFQSYVTDGTVYDTYYVIFNQYDQDNAYSPVYTIDETTIIAAPTGSISTGIQTVLTAYLGTPTNESGLAISTTTTSSTTSTTSTTTTTLIP